jgi:hypothetical protein
MLKDHIADIDNTILKDIFCAASSALDNVDIIAEVSMQTGISKERIYALLPIIFDLAGNNRPRITNEKEIEGHQKKLKTCLKI